MEGKPSGRSTCTECGRETEEDIYRCLDCDGLELLCKDCTMVTHLRAGLHRIEVRIDFFLSVGLT